MFMSLGYTFPCAILTILHINFVFLYCANTHFLSPIMPMAYAIWCQSLYHKVGSYLNIVYPLLIMFLLLASSFIKLHQFSTLYCRPTHTLYLFGSWVHQMTKTPYWNLFFNTKCCEWVNRTVTRTNSVSINEIHTDGKQIQFGLKINIKWSLSFHFSNTDTEN